MMGQARAEDVAKEKGWGPVVLEAEAVGRRIDQVLSEQLPTYSRSQLQRWILEGWLLLDGMPCTDKAFRLAAQHRTLELKALRALPTEHAPWLPHAGPLDLCFEDEALMVVNKPAGLVVHPGAGHWEGTLVNRLVHHCPALSELPRAGLVHRLDKGTTGLLVVTKTLEAQIQMVRQIQARRVEREYRCWVRGAPPPVGRIEGRVGRDPRCRTRMALLSREGKPALTHFQVLEHFSGCSWLKVTLGTGRTHQIRVHLSHRGFPLLGDTTYGGPKSLSLARGEPLIWERPALHAFRLRFQHPLQSEHWLELEAPFPEDFQQAWRRLKEFSEGLEV